MIPMLHDPELDDLLRGANPVPTAAASDDAGTATLTRDAVLVARAVSGGVQTAVRQAQPGRRFWRRGLASGVLGAALVIPAGAYVVAEVTTSHTGRHATQTSFDSDTSEVINTCGTDFATVLPGYAPTDRALPGRVTWAQISTSLLPRMQEGCDQHNSAVARGEAQTADSLRLNFEFAAQTAWEVQWVKAMRRHDATTAAHALQQYELTATRPLVVRRAHDAGQPSGYVDQVTQAIRRGDVAFVAGVAGVDPMPAGTGEGGGYTPPAWYQEIH